MDFDRLDIHSDMYFTEFLTFDNFWTKTLYRMQGLLELIILQIEIYTLKGYKNYIFIKERFIFFVQNSQKKILKEFHNSATEKQTCV